MAELFKTIVITSPYEIENEANKIRMLLESGVDRVHIRKPDSSPAEVKELIEQIPYPLRRKLTLHGHFHLLDEMNLGGVHLNSRNPNAPKTRSRFRVHAIRSKRHSGRLMPKVVIMSRSLPFLIRFRKKVISRTFQ